MVERKTIKDHHKRVMILAELKGYYKDKEKYTIWKIADNLEKLKIARRNTSTPFLKTLISKGILRPAGTFSRKSKEVYEVTEKIENYIDLEESNLVPEFMNIREVLLKELSLIKKKQNYSLVIEINKDLHEFDINEQMKFLEILRTTLIIHNEIKLTKVLEASINLHLELDVDDVTTIISILQEKPSKIITMVKILSISTISIEYKSQLITFFNVKELQSLNQTQLINIKRKIQEWQIVAKTHLDISKIYIMQDRIKKVNLNLQIALNIFEMVGDEEGIAEVYYWFGLAEERSANYDKALRMYRKCELIGSNTKATLITVKALQAYGRMLSLMGASKVAMGKLQKALEYIIKLDKPKELSSVYISLGNCAYNLADLEGAIKYNKKAISVARDASDLRLQAYALANLASVYIEVPDLLKAKKSLENAEKLFEKLNDKKMLSSIYMIYANLNSARNDWDKAQCYLNDAILILETMNAKRELAGAKLSFALMYETMGEIEKADEYYKEAYELNKKLRNGEIRENPIMISELNEYG